MNFRTVFVIPIRPTTGTVWWIIGILFAGWLVLRSDPAYKSEEGAEREISVKFKRNSTQRLSPKPKITTPSVGSPQTGKEPDAPLPASTPQIVPADETGTESG